MSSMSLLELVLVSMILPNTRVTECLEARPWVGNAGLNAERSSLRQDLQHAMHDLQNRRIAGMFRQIMAL